MLNTSMQTAFGKLKEEDRIFTKLASTDLRGNSILYLYMGKIEVEKSEQ